MKEPEKCMQVNQKRVRARETDCGKSRAGKV
jgi:hypothetical protein